MHKKCGCVSAQKVWVCVCTKGVGVCCTNCVGVCAESVCAHKRVHVCVCTKGVGVCLHKGVCVCTKGVVFVCTKVCAHKRCVCAKTACVHIGRGCVCTKGVCV